MVNKVRNIHNFSNTKFQQEYENGIYSKIPKSEDFVDNLDISASSEYAENRFKDALKESIKQIRRFLLSTRLMTVTDCTNAFLSLADSGYIKHLNKKLKFYETKKLQGTNYNGVYDYTNVSIGLSNNMFLKGLSQEQTIKTLIHELMHFLILTFNIEYKLTNDLRVKISRKKSPLSKLSTPEGLEYIEKELIDNYGNTKSKTIITSPILNSRFLSEGYTELISQLIYPLGSKTYHPQVKMVELLQFVTGQDSDFEGFFRWELNKQKNCLGKDKFEKFLKHVNKFQKLYGSNDKVRYLIDEDYLQAQNILINHYVKNVISQFVQDQNASDCTDKILSLFPYIPSIQKKNTMLIKEILNTINKNNPSQDIQNIMNHLDKYIECKAQFYGAPQDLNTKKVDMSIARDFNNEVNIYINEMLLDNKSIQELLNTNNGYKVLNLNDIKNKKLIDVIKVSNMIRFIICDDNDMGYLTKTQLDINFARLNTENIIEYQEDCGPIEKIEFYDTSLNQKIDELINFTAHFNDLKAIQNNFKTTQIKAIYIINPREEDISKEALYVIENKNGSFDFYSKYKNSTPSKMNIINGLYLNSNDKSRNIYKPFLVENEETGKLVNGHIQCDVVEKDFSEIVYVLENGSVIEIIDKNDNTKQILLNKKGDLHLPNLSCVYSCDNELIDLKCINQNKKTEEVENEEVPH